MAEDAPVFEVTPDNFQAAVIDRSAQQPVLLLFWAAQIPESAQAQQTLAQLVPRYAGKVALALVDVAQDQTLAQHLRVQGLPSVRVIQNGQIAGQLDGPQPETAYAQMLDDLTLSSAEALQQVLGQLLEAGDLGQARAMLQQAIEEEPNNQAFRVEFADVLARQGLAGDAQALADARQVLAAIPEQTAERERPAERLRFAEDVAGLPPLAELEARVAGGDDELELRYQLALRQAAEGAAEPALELLLGILQQDRKFRDDGARELMLRIFSMLGKGSKLAGQFRRRMFNFLH
ncbi:MAG: tetratricopeptide repeat protein [Pseudomonadota bacterium]